MTAYVWSAVLALGIALAAAILLECVLRRLVRGCAHLLPDELCGPDGWLVDTDRKCGVFDRVARR